MGHIVSEITRERIRASLRGHCVSEETRRRISESKKGKPPWNVGIPVSDKTKVKLRAISEGKKASEETRKKMSDAHRGHHHNLGHIPSVDVVRKRSESLKGHPVSDMTRQKISIGHKGKTLSMETKRRIAIAGKKRFENPNEILRNIEIGLGGFWYGNVRYYEGPQYCEKFNSDLRERVRAYWGYVCFECGTPQNGSTLHVHHVHYNKKACCDGSPRDMVPLCTSCHAKTNRNRKYWESYFTEMLMDYYGGKCYFTKEEMEAFNSLNSS